jgi:hypothetical protein
MHYSTTTSFSRMQEICNANKKLLQCDKKYIQTEISAYQKNSIETKDMKIAKWMFTDLQNKFLGVNWKDFYYTYAATTSLIISCFFMNEQNAYRHPLKYYYTDPEVTSKIMIMCVFSLISTCINVISVESVGKQWTVASTAVTYVAAQFLQPSEIQNKILFCMIAALPFALIFCKSHSRKKLLQNYMILIERMEALTLNEPILKTLEQVLHYGETYENSKNLHIGTLSHNNTLAVARRIASPNDTIFLQVINFFIGGMKTNAVMLHQKQEKTMTTTNIVDSRRFCREVMTFLKKGDFEVGEYLNTHRAEMIISIFNIFKSANETACKMSSAVMDNRYFGWQIMSALRCDEISDSMKGKMIHNMFEVMKKLQQENSYNSNLYAVTQTEEFQKTLARIVPSSVRKQWQKEGLLDVIEFSWRKFINLKFQPTLAPTMFGLQKCNIF